MDRMFRRLIIVGSVSFRRKLRDDTEDQLDMKESLFHSWILQDCNSAIKNERFLTYVMPNLDAHFQLSAGINRLQIVTADEITGNELLASKHHFAGSSSRLMFDCNVIDCS
jgi:hypothetical protein